METRGKNRLGARVPKEAKSSCVSKVKFTSKMWNKWLDEFNSGPVPELEEGIKIFRSLCREPVDDFPGHAYIPPTQEK